MSEYMETFLSSVRKSTANSWRRGITLFTEWSGKSVDTLLQERKDDLTPRPDENFIDQKNRANRFERELEKFHKWMVDKGYKMHACMHLLKVIRG